MLRACLVLFGAIAVGCGNPETFACDSPDDCSQGASGGLCEPSGYCSFPDASCMSGRRYGEHAPAGIAGTCAPSSDDTGGSSGASETATTSATLDTTTMPAADDTSTGSGTPADTSDSSTSTGLGSSSGVVETSTSAATSTGAEDCDALDCLSCTGCAISPDGPCAEPKAACDGMEGCTSAAECIEGCVVSGACFDPCCEGLSPETADTVDELVLCVEYSCPTACNEIEFFTCGET